MGLETSRYGKDTSPPGIGDVDPRLWQAGVGLMALTLAAGAALIAALALGWNSPRPTRPPDWEAELPLKMAATDDDEAEMQLLGHPAGDFGFEVEAVPAAGPDHNGYGLVYRARDEAHCYVFAVGSDGYYAVLRINGDEEEPLVDWQQFPHVRRQREPNRLRVECAGATCRFTINDEVAATVEDDTWLAGDVGLWVRGFGEETVEVEFVKARVWEDRTKGS